MHMSASQPAVLAFSDGVVFSGIRAGYPAAASGEIVFNTAVCGYQEIISDPSYHRQIVNFTYPHIGNTGATLKDDEAVQFAAAGIVARRIFSCKHWRAERSLNEYLCERKIPAISEVDTRAVTCKIREGGALSACIYPDDGERARKDAIDAAAGFAGLSGAMLADEAGHSRPMEWRAGQWQARENDFMDMASASQSPSSRRRVAVLDCGVKSAILRQLAARNCQVSVLPYDAPLDRVRQAGADGVVFSNGPGDPEPCASAIELAKELMSQNVPLLGICLGHQILALALGAKTVKMKFGHHGANHPVRDEQTGQVMVTSQNHGFAVDAQSLPSCARITHTSLFDGTLQGLACDTPPMVTFQGHPEASPGPHDAGVLFDRFVQLMDGNLSR